MTEPPPQCRKKKQALRDIEAKGITLEKAFELGAEEAIIERQLGFLPTNVHSVAARSESGTNALWSMSYYSSHPRAL